MNASVVFILNASKVAELLKHAGVPAAVIVVPMVVLCAYLLLVAISTLRH